MAEFHLVFGAGLRDMCLLLCEYRTHKVVVEGGGYPKMYAL